MNVMYMLINICDKYINSNVPQRICAINFSSWPHNSSTFLQVFADKIIKACMKSIETDSKFKMCLLQERCLCLWLLMHDDDFKRKQESFSFTNAARSFLSFLSLYSSPTLVFLLFISFIRWWLNWRFLLHDFKYAFMNTVLDCCNTRSVSSSTEENF